MNGFYALNSKCVIQLLSRAWRGQLANVASSATRSVLIAAPFIKHSEAVWFSELLAPGVDIVTLANIDAEAVGSSALDIDALLHLAEASQSSRLIAMPNLHAKVFIADEKAAIVTSGNLTRSALDSNLEYGVLLRERRLVQTVREDMLSFARLGSQVDPSTIAKLAPLEKELRKARASVSTSSGTKIKFEQIMRKARPEFASTQVGGRSAHAVFGEAIKFVLSEGPQNTKNIQCEVKDLMPALCDDSVYFTIKGERYGKAWKRRLRHAQLHLKRRGEVTYNPSKRVWALSGT